MTRNIPAAAEFEIGDILTAMTGRLVARAGIDAMYRIAEHLTGGPVWTHQLPRVSREAEPILRAAFPDLAAIEIPDLGPDQAAWMAWLERTEREHGRTRMVTPLAADDHTDIDPIAELKMMRPDMPIVAVALED